MNRRSFVSLSAGALLASGQAPSRPPLRFTQARTGAGPFRTQGSRPPHILVLSADMVSPDLYHPSRPFSEHVRLPALRALMADGTFFSNAFCTVPLCAPSRASYLTGRYSYIQGNGERAPEGLKTELRPDDIIFPEYLQAAGYITRHVGKSHVGEAKFVEAFGENDRSWNRWSPPVFDDDSYLAYQRSLGVKPQRYAREIVFRQQDRSTPGNSAGGWVVQEDGKPFPLEAQYSWFQGQQALEILDSLHANGSLAKRPLYLQLDLFDPHQPFAIPSGFEGRERELRAALTLPESYREVQERNFARAGDEPEIVDLYRRYWGIYEPEKLLDYRVAYALQMELVDRVLGRVLDRFRELGLYDDTFVVFLSDHGEMNGRRATVDKGVYLHPDVLRVPLVLKAPGRPGSRAKAVNAPVSLLDLSRTLLGAAGIEPEAEFDGVSLLPYLESGQGDQERALFFFGGWHVGVNFCCGIGRRAADGRRYLYGYNCTSAVDELYDLDSPDAENLIDRGQLAPVREELVRALGEALAADPRWTGYWAEFRIARYASLPKTGGDQQLFTKPA